MFNPTLLTPVPVRYEAGIESLPDESGVHPRDDMSAELVDHGLLKGELRVLTGLPPVLAHGLFSTPMAFPMLMRLSTRQGGPTSADGSPATLVMAIKLVGTEGARLPGSEGDVTQDFLFVNTPASSASASAKTGFQKVISAMAPGGLKHHLAPAGDKHILGETFHTTSPLLHGPYMARLSVVPISPGLLLLKQACMDLQGRPHGLREAVVDFFSTHSAEWELRVQLCTDLQAMPIEDDAVRWPEELSPPLPVARITVPPQPAWSEARAAALNGHCAFNPWHGLAAHRPLGASMRANMPRETQLPTREPRSLDDLPD